VVPPRKQVLFGAAYYHEYQPSPRLDTDLDLMAEAGFSVIRVGESVWTTWEPEDGRFDLDWLAPVLDGAQQRGIAVVLGTPTYAAPPWLARRYPEIAGEPSTGQPMAWGGRQEIDYTHPAFKFYAERIIRKIVARYASHPAIIGYQVDNEPGMLLFHNHGVFQRFVDELRHTYGTVEAINKAWGLVYWSHKLSTWSDLWTPDGNWQPQYDLAWRTFQAKLTTEFIAWQADIVREYARDHQFVTTCIAYERPTVDDANLTAALDVTAGNPYYAMQDALAVPSMAVSPQGWTTSGAWSLFLSADRMYASKQAPFLITETNAGAIGGSSTNFPAYDGQWRQAAWAFIARGAEMIEYWHWHTNHFGTETYWIGVLPHDQQPGRVYAELSRLGAELQTAGSRVLGLRPDAQIGMLYSARSKWGSAFQAAFPKPGATSVGSPSDLDQRSYHRIFDAFYRGTFDAGVPARLIHDIQLIGPDGSRLHEPARLAAELPILIVAGLLVADDDLLTWLRDYAAVGGHLVIGPRTAYGDEEGRARLEVKPAHLAKDAGVRYQEFSNLTEPLSVVAETDAIDLSEGAAATGWVDMLISDGAKVIVGYEDRHFGRFPAVVSSEHGRGRITTVGTVPNPVFAADLVRSFVGPAADKMWKDLPASVTVYSATNPDGERVHVIHNWGWASVEVGLPHTMIDVLKERGRPAKDLELGPWDVRVVAEHLSTKTY
jgi:beta-galactosidase